MSEKLQRSASRSVAMCAIAVLLVGATVRADDLATAIEDGNLSAVEGLLAAGADVNRPDEYGFTPLFRAVFHNQREIAQYLIAEGADVNAKLTVQIEGVRRGGVETPEKRTAVSATVLAAASSRGQKGMVELLVQSGADVNQETDDGVGPLSAALDAGHQRIVRLLLDNGADLNSIRLDDHVGSKVLAGMLFADLPLQGECDWGGAGSKPAPAPAFAFPISGQVVSYPTGTRASRGVPVEVPDDGAIRAGTSLRFVDNRDGTVSDLNTGLMWEKKCGGGGGLHDYRRVYRWAHPLPAETIWGWIASVNAERGTGFAGYGDWRIPNVKELQSIIDYGHHGPAVTKAFGVDNCQGCTDLRDPGCSCSAPSHYWTSTTFADFVGHAFSLGFGLGLVDDTVKSQRLFVRAVRSID